MPATDAMYGYTADAQALANRTVVITGATGGLGTELSKACAAAGATVVLVGKTVKKLEALYDVIDSMDAAPQPAIVPLNQAVATEDDYHSIANMIKDEFGTVDSLVHTAAELGSLTPQHTIAQSDWSRIMSVNFTSARLLSNECLPLMAASDNASIIFSVDHKLSAYWGPYGIAKNATSAFAHMFADETENRTDSDGNPSLAVLSIDPGAMRTPLRRKAFPGELESETAPPTRVLGVYMTMITRQNRQLNKTCVTCYV